MNVHKNARLTPQGRLLLVRRITEEGWRVADAAQAAGCKMIIESIVTTLAKDGAIHIAPMGVIWRDDTPVLAPFRPSTTLDNLAAHPFAVINHTDDVRIFAGCLTGRRDWPTRRAEKVVGHVLVNALSHQEVAVERRDEDEMRSRFSCRVVYTANHRPFGGFNRAQAAVIVKFAAIATAGL